MENINQWTFGILTNGKRDKEVEDEIESIIALKIPEYEIIICGTFRNGKKREIRHIKYEPKIPWITMKKNMICKEAKYENIVITHDRFTFDKDWFKGMKEYGNDFEVLSCIIINPEGDRANDWITFGSDLNEKPLIGRQGLLDYRDWNNGVYIDGGLIILKKSVWKKVKWDESLLWNQGEDIEFSGRLHKVGVSIAFNNKSICLTTTTKEKLLEYEYGTTKLLGESVPRKIKNFVKKSHFGKHYFALRDGVKEAKQSYGRYPIIK